MGERQGRSVAKPRVGARNERLPWGHGKFLIINPAGVEARADHGVPGSWITFWRPRITFWRPRITFWRPTITFWRLGITFWRPGITLWRLGITFWRPGITL